MNLFELIFTQPIFNLLVFLYGIIPGKDLGIAVILFTVIIRLLLWPLVKKQLHQSKLMREIQPQLAAVRKKAKGNKQLEATMMMELYKEKGISPFGSIGLLIVQLPFFIALFSAINIVANHRGDIPKFTYDFLQSIPAVKEIVANPNSLNESFLGFIDLTKSAFSSGGAAMAVLVVIAIATAILQFYQSKQLLPVPKDKKRLRDILKDQAAGKEVDQSEVMASVSRRTMYLFPVLMLVAAVSVVGALELYLFTQTLVAYIQQQFVLGKDVEEMEDIAEKPAKKTPEKPANEKPSAASRANKAKTAKVVKRTSRKKK